MSITLINTIEMQYNCKKKKKKQNQVKLQKKKNNKVHFLPSKNFFFAKCLENLNCL